MDEISEKPEEIQGSYYQRAMTKLWDIGQREIGTRLTKDFILMHPEEERAQRWLKKIISDEKKLSEEIFDAAFLSEHYNPNVKPGGGG